MLNVSFITLGCKVNQFESEAMMEIFEKEGFKIIPSSKDTDIFVINTCAVTSESDRKSRQLINKAKRINEKAIVVAVGCSVQLNADKISKETSVDIIIGTKNKGDVAKIIREKIDSGIVNVGIEKFVPKEKFEELTISKEHDKTRANIKVQDGCNQFCTYCIIPYVRGPIRSRNLEDILEEINVLAENGYKEVVINGIHISSYGKDIGINDALIELMESINKIHGLERIRLGSLEPNIITEDFIVRMKNLNKACDHFHLSLQSGSDTILKLMNRRYTAKEYKEKVELIRKYYPLAGITTDIIVGFPGETQKEFQETLDFVKDIEFSRIHVFKYSKRKGTKAADFQNQVDESIKSERSKVLISLSDSISKKFMSRLIGTDMDVLIERKHNEYFEGYTTNYVRALISSNKLIDNQIMRCLVETCEDDYIVGKII